MNNRCAILIGRVPRGVWTCPPAICLGERREYCCEHQTGGLGSKPALWNGHCTRATRGRRQYRRGYLQQRGGSIRNVPAEAACRRLAALLKCAVSLYQANRLSRRSNDGPRGGQRRPLANPQRAAGSLRQLDRISPVPAAWKFCCYGSAGGWGICQIPRSGILAPAT